jgi:hypothetical protein
MARYTSLCTVGISLEKFQPALTKVLESCDLKIIYVTGDYVMATENPGRVTYAKLVTVEVLIDKTVATDEAIKMSFVVKNEELPLQVENHCRKMFELVTRTVEASDYWRLIETVTS